MVILDLSFERVKSKKKKFLRRDIGQAGVHSGGLSLKEQVFLETCP